jgi:hypothetical protein
MKFLIGNICDDVMVTINAIHRIKAEHLEEVEFIKKELEKQMNGKFPLNRNTSKK